MTGGGSASVGMPVVPTLRALIDALDDRAIVVTNQGSARVWPKLCQRPLDFHYNPSTMGGGIPLALGVALAQPGREVLAVTGDGSLLMSLGSLVTVVGAGALNLTVVLLDNGIYEVTGGQETPASGSPVDFPGFARAAGFPSVDEFHELAEWQARVGAIFGGPGPRFVRLEVQATPEEYLRAATPPIAEQLAALQGALAAPGPK